jgi:hypothetical protein
MARRNDAVTASHGRTSSGPIPKTVRCRQSFTSQRRDSENPAGKQEMGVGGAQASGVLSGASLVATRWQAAGLVSLVPECLDGVEPQCQPGGINPNVAEIPANGGCQPIGALSLGAHLLPSADFTEGDIADPSRECAGTRKTGGLTPAVRLSVAETATAAMIDGSDASVGHRRIDRTSRDAQRPKPIPRRHRTG